jgi:hypothetical protein
MKQFLIDLLKSLESIVAPPPNCHHAITYAKFGSDETEWQDELALQVNKDGEFLCFFLDDEDFAQKPEEVANKIGTIILKGTSDR